ncbi:MAG TPA: glycoside hydrolase family 31 protein [Niabella sp.]|nr:glycoside hydrolase family 31 protein [Niabella sp.]
MQIKKFIRPLFIIVFTLVTYSVSNAQQTISDIKSVKKTDGHTAEVTFNDNRHFYIDFYGENIFRVFCSLNGDRPHDPVAKPPAKILVDQPRKTVSKFIIADNGKEISFTTKTVKLAIDKQSGIFKASNLLTQKPAFQFLAPISIEKNKVSVSLAELPDEYFFGGGVQNGRFTHKGKIIAIENQNSWTDGGVASPNPFYWSDGGYGVMWHSFKPGRYDFGATEKGKVKLFHNDSYFDVFFMVNDTPVALLNDFYQLTGHPVLLPKFGFYEGHLNAYNRDYWKEDSTGTRGILFEDGKRYTESQTNNGGIKESLNGEKNNYQFSARGVIDRYKKHDMPFGWILPNDGYGAGYGQTGTLDSNILNLKSLGDYARAHGVQIGLWTQSDLHPKEGISALLQRDIVKEVRDAGVRVLKTDVAWVGAGYSFGLNGVADVATIMPKYGNNARPFIILLDGWAGTQRYATIWTGDQTGGNWEYIRFHIPTYLGSGLSGQPNITSDMDGIFGGKNEAVNIRDFQWKTFTPMQLNMDGWGSNEKYPHALGEPATSINRMYLKMKSELLPYAYSIAQESVTGMPQIRAMFLNDKNDFTLSKATQYQFLYGPYFLVAPIYQNTKGDNSGNDIRNNVYLPKGTWIDYFTGEKYEGGRVINSVAAPIWKLPIFVKAGAIIPVTHPNNNVSEIDNKLRSYEIYPNGKTHFTEYDDDGVTEEYLQGKSVTTLIESDLRTNEIATITVFPAKGNYSGFEKTKATEFKINATTKPKRVTAYIGTKKIALQPAGSESEYNSKSNVYFYTTPELNRFATPGSDFKKVSIKKNPQIWVKTAPSDITKNTVKLVVEGYVFAPKDESKKQSGKLSPVKAAVSEKNREAFKLKPGWQPEAHADYYEIDFNKMLYSTIRDTTFLLDDLQPETEYQFKIRAVNKSGVSPWASFAATTKSNPLQFAIKGIKARTSVRNQSGASINNLFDFDESNLWHTQWGSAAVPFDMVIDLNSVNQIDKFQYLPREGAGNGTLLKGKVYYSNNKTDWTEAGSFDWKRNGDTKEFVFATKPTVRYIKLDVTEAVGNFGSGKELYVFKVPGTESYLPGDINNDKLIDANDLTSYMNYVGLRSGDGDFEGYISKGDLNQNGLIDAYDISTVATQLEGGAWEQSRDTLAGKIELVPDKQNYKEGETISILVKGLGLKVVNALSFALPYNPADYDYVGIEPLNMKQLDNFTRDRLHTNGQKALYPTFVNVGDKETLNGSNDLFIIKFKARHDLTFSLKPKDGMLVDKRLEELKW